MKVFLVYAHPEPMSFNAAYLDQWSAHLLAACAGNGRLTVCRAIGTSGERR